MEKKNKTRLARAAMTLLLSLLTTIGAWGQVNVPYTEGFENMSSADDLTAAGWELLYQSGSGSFLAIETNASNVLVGSKSLNIDAYNTGNSSDYAIVGLPVVNAAINTLQITFSYKTSGGHNVQIGYLTDANDGNTFTSLEQFDTSSSYVTKTVELNEAPATAARIAIKYEGYYRLYIDDIEVKVLPSCKQPQNLTVSGLTNQGATLTWQRHAQGTEDSWVLEYSTNSDFTSATTLNVTGNPSKALTGLTAGETYYAHVKADCGGGESSDWSTTKSFTTLCNSTTIPAEGWNENFDNYTHTSNITSVNILPDCWNYINTTSYSSYKGYPMVYYGSNYSHSGNYSLRFYSYYSSWSNYDPQDQYAILPPMEDLTGKQITLYARGYDSNSSFKIGTMTDPSDPSTFVAITEQTGLTTSYQEFSYPLSGTNTCVAIMIEAATSSRTTNSVYIDDITIDDAPSCVKPINLAVEVHGQDATLTWETGARWSEIVHSMNPGFDPDAEPNPVSTENVYTLEYSELDLGDHYFWVRSACGGDDNSEWVGPISCHIGYCTPKPTSHDSNGITGVSFGIGDYVVTNGDGSASIPASAPYYGDYSTMVGAVQAGVESTIAITTGTGSYPYTFVIWVDLDNSLSFEDSEILHIGKASAGNGTYNAIITIPATQPLGDYRMRIYGADSYFTSFYNGGNPDYTKPHDPCSEGSYRHAHDYTLRVLEAPSCLTPTGLTVSDVAAHEATISWTSDADAWQILLGEEDPIDVDEATYTFTGLAAETAYSVKVRTNCDGTYSEWTNPVSFTTGIACPVPTVAVSNITTTTAEVSCTNTEADHFNVKLGEDVVDEGVEMPYTLTGLTANTTYTVKVQAICGGEDGESAWSSGTTFTTADICPEGMVCIGSGTSTNNYLPTYTLYNYSLSQQIYTAEEIGQAGAIYSVDFYMKNTSSNTYTRNLDIYMVNTEKETFSSNTDWIPVTSSDLVFSGEVTFTDNDWTTIEFDSPFVYDGNSNIVLVVDDNTGSWLSTPSFYAFNAPSQAIRVYNDDTNYAPTNPPTTGNTLAVQNMKNRVRFAIGEASSCLKPTGLTFSNVTKNSAELSWTSTADTWDIDINGTVTSGITENPYTLTGLTPETAYTVKVRANCGGGVVSEWSKAVTFTTDVAYPAPTGVMASNITPTSATISWTGFADSYEMEYCIGDGFDFDDGTLQGWTNLIVNEEGGQWIHSNNNQGGYDYTSLAHGGTGFAMCYSFIDNVGAYDTDAYLISPQNYLITDGASLHFWYDMANDTYPENFEVCIATTDNPTTSDNFTNIWSLSNAKGNGGEKTNVRKRNTRYDNWREVTIDLSDYAGQSIWIAFHDVNEDMYEVWIDDITINSGQNWIPVEGTITDTQYTLTGLNPETSYMVRVRAIYDGEGESAWAVTSFKTLGEAMINFAAEGYATYYNSQKDVVLPDGMQAKIVTEGTSDGTLTYENIADGNIVHAGNAMLLQVSVATAANSPISIGLATPSAAAISGTNLLHGSDTRVDITTLDDYSADNYYYYMLSYDQNGENIGWYWDKDNTNGTGFWSEAHKAWLALPKSLFQGSGAPFLGLPGWEDTTGIVPVGVNPEDGEWYTLQGLKIGKKPTTKGVYIHNGKKVLIP